MQHNKHHHCQHGVPQGSGLEPSLVSLYTTDISRLMSNFVLFHHCYADDTQLYGTC